MRRRAKTPFRWLRRVLLLAGVAGVAGLVLLLMAYSFGNVETQDPSTAASGGSGDGTDDDAVTQTENIDYVQTSGGQRVFRVRAARSFQDEQDVSRLQDVTLDIFRDDGDVYTIKSDRAEIDQSSLEAQLEGNVVVRGLGELVLRTRALEVKQKGGVLESNGAVELSFPPQRLEGRASRLRLDRVGDQILLSGGVHVRNVAGAEALTRLDCDRLVYKRAEGLIRAVDDVYLRRGDSEIQAHYISIYLQQDQKTLRALTARWNVVGTVASLMESGGRVIAGFSGQFLEVEPSEENPEYRKIRLDGSLEEPADMRLVQDDGLARALVGRRIDARAEGDRLIEVEGFGDPMRLDEYFDLPQPYMLRRACADRAVANFLPDGQLARIVLEGQVDLRDDGFQASGAQLAVLEVPEERLNLRGPSVELFTDRGDVVAPQIRYARQTGLIKATQGVETTLVDASDAGLSGTPLGGGSGPVRVSSKEATFTEVPPKFVFVGDVRAWQGQNLLIADQMRGDEASQEMAASGGVKTVWIPERNRAAATAAENRPVEVTAKTLSYRRLDRQLVYLEDVKVAQGERTITCDELTVDLEEDGGADRMRCRGEVEVVDPTGGQKVTGESAVYTVAQDLVEVFGEEVKLLDAQRNELVGQYLRFDLETGKARVLAKPPGASAVAPDPGIPQSVDGAPEAAGSGTPGADWVF
ncbi:MAG: LPS export ABC transporter periplasmic protein LptC [Acidobacteriota bacterium]